MSTFVSRNDFLTLDEQKVNALYIRDYLLPRGWSMNAIAGMLGNMAIESTINPAIWENLDAGNDALGYGLVQWTPATKFIDWCDARRLDITHMDSALARIEYELDNGLQWIATDAYPMSFADFKTSTQSAYYLGCAFVANYERPAELNSDMRGTNAAWWYDYIDDGTSSGGGTGSGSGSGSEGGTGSGSSTPKKEKRKMPRWLLIKAAGGRF